MIAADTSTWIAFLQGGKGEDAELLDRALEDRQVLMVPAVLTELLSDPEVPSSVAETLSEVPLIEIKTGCCQRAEVLRAKVLAKAPRSALRRCADCPELCRPWHSSPQAFFSSRETYHI